MEESPHVMTINLHKLVTDECGHAPFDMCYMMKKPNDVVCSLVIYCICIS